MDFQKKQMFIFCLILKINSTLSDWTIKHRKTIQFKTRMKETSLLETTAENTLLNLKWLKTSSQNNYLFPMRNFWIHLFVHKIMRDSHSNFLSISTSEQFANSVQCIISTVIEKLYLLLPTRIFEFHHFQLFYVVCFCTWFWVWPPSALGSLVYSETDIMQDWVSPC